MVHFIVFGVIIYIIKEVEVVEHLLYIVAYHDHDHFIALEVLSSCTYGHDRTGTHRTFPRRGAM